jgi:predicted PurR-regulated permease PerM
MKKLQIEISTGTMLRAVFIVLLISMLFFVRDILVLLFLAVIVSSTLDPLVDILERKKIWRVASVSFIYLITFLVVGLAISLLIPPIIYQFNEFSQNIPHYYQKMQNLIEPIGYFFQTKNIIVDTQSIFNNLNGWLSQAPRNIFSTTVGVFSGLIATVSVLAMAFYMTLVRDGIKKTIVAVTPRKYQKHVAGLTVKIKHQIGKWMQGQIVLMMIVFILDFIGLSLIGLPYALILAIIAGFLEIIPYVGPILASVPGIILGFLISPTVGLLALLIYFVVQQVEGHIIVPLVMKKAVGLNPVAVIVALLIGAKLGGILGAIIAVPVATAIDIFVQDFFSREKESTLGLKHEEL